VPGLIHHQREGGRWEREGVTAPTSPSHSPSLSYFPLSISMSLLLPPYRGKELILTRRQGEEGRRR
jgi:hypothetical protein